MLNPLGRVLDRNRNLTLRRATPGLRSIFAFIAAWVAFAPGARADYPADTKIGGPDSRYTPYVIRLSKSWPPADLDYAASAKDPNPVHCRCIETPGDKYYIGLDQWMRVEAPLERVAAVLDDVGHYQELFRGFDEIKLISRDENRFLTFWEQHIPVPLVPNVKYSVDYLVTQPKAGVRVYRYQLADSEGDKIKNNDGLIVLETMPASAGKPAWTRYSEIDFYNADWGILKTLSPGRIWRDSVEGLYLSDLAIKFKAENPGWTYKKVNEEAKQVLDQFPVEPLLQKRRQLKL